MICSNSISSDGQSDPLEIAVKEGWVDFDAAHYAQAAERGYALCTLTPDSLTVDFRTVDFRTVETVLEPDAPVQSHARFVIDRSDLVPSAS